MGDRVRNGRSQRNQSRCVLAARSSIPGLVPYTASLHNHTFRCHHASGDAADYVAAAVAGGCRVIGIADHVPTPDDRWGDVRMRLDELPGYVAAVRGAARADATVLLGLECEYVPDFAAFQRDELLGRHGCDYLIGAVHYVPWQGGWISAFGGCRTSDRLRAFADHAVATIASGLYAFLAHPDVFAAAPLAWNADTAAVAREVCAAAAAHGVPLELNHYGMRKEWVAAPGGARPAYPWPPFWEVAATHGCRVVLSSDAHRPQDAVVGWDDLAALRDRLGLVEAPAPWRRAQALRAQRP